jgi:uncharacterized protein (DUF1330 family)
MAKGYWIAHINVTDPERYKSYVAEAGPAYQAHGAKFVIRGGAGEQVEGTGLGSRHVVIEFESLEQAKACYNSDAYQKAKRHREAASTGDILIVEGVA